MPLREIDVFFFGTQGGNVWNSWKFDFRKSDTSIIFLLKQCTCFNVMLAPHLAGRASISSTGQMFVGRWSQTCLFLDCIMMCYVVTLGLIDMDPWLPGVAHVWGEIDSNC